MCLYFVLSLLYTSVVADDFCTKFGSAEVVDDLLSRTRNQLPSSFMLPDRVGLIGIYSANFTNLNTFTRSRERQINCGEDTIRVPVIWYRKPTGRFMARGKHLKFVRKVYEVTIGILEATLVIGFKPADDKNSSVATLKTLSVTRLSKISVRAIGFGMIGKILSTITTLIIRFFETVFHAFMEDNLKNEIENVMVHIPVSKYFPTFFFDSSPSEDEVDDEDTEDSEVFFPGVKLNGGKPKISRDEFISEKEDEDFEVFNTKTQKPPWMKKVDEDELEASERDNSLDNEEMELWVPGADEVEVFGPNQKDGVEKEMEKPKDRDDNSGRPPKERGEMEMETKHVALGGEKEGEDHYDPKLDYETLDPRQRNWLK